MAGNESRWIDLVVQIVRQSQVGSRTLYALNAGMLTNAKCTTTTGPSITISKSYSSKISPRRARGSVEQKQPAGALDQRKSSALPIFSVRSRVRCRAKGRRYEMEADSSIVELEGGELYQETRLKTITGIRTLLLTYPHFKF